MVLFLALLASPSWRGACCSEYIDVPRMPKCSNSFSTLSFPTTSFDSIVSSHSPAGLILMNSGIISNAELLIQLKQIVLSGNPHL